MAKCRSSIECYRESSASRAHNVSQEFANVLWLHKEEKPTTEYLQALLSDHKHVGVIERGL